MADTPRLFTYITPIDDGAAPNPFHGMCSLAICKPGIRRIAKVKDWVVGLGSKHAPSGDFSGKVVYAMQVEEIRSMHEYDRLAVQRWPHRRPNIQSRHLPDRLGDCIYNYSSGSPIQRPSVHGEANIKTDLSGERVLISHDEFYYFGQKAQKLPRNLLPICPQTQGHRSDSNARYLDIFVSWVRGLKFEKGLMHGWPDFIIDWEKASTCGGCLARKEDGEKDTPC
jgi:hypothetical protein